MGGVQFRLDFEGLDILWPVDEIPLDVCPERRYRCQRRYIGARKRLEIVGGDLGRAVATEEFVVEKQTHFRNHEMSCNNERAQ